MHVGQTEIKTAKSMQESNTIRKVLLRSGLQVCACHVTVIACAIADSEIRWGIKEDLDAAVYQKFKEPTFYIMNSLRLIALVCCFLSSLFTHTWHTTNITHLKQRNKIPHSVNFPFKMRVRFVLEVLICFIHIPPFIDVGLRTFNERQWLDYLTILCFTKIYIFVRLMKEKSPLNSNSGRFIGSFTNIEFTDLFYVKTWLKDNPFAAMLYAVVALLFTCSYMIYLAERVHPVDCSEVAGKFSSYPNALWLIIVTVFTVGYGELAPQTDIGRFIAIVAALCGLVLSATLIGLVHQYLTLNNDEASVLKFISEHQRIKQY